MSPLCNANIEVLRQLEELVDCCEHIYVQPPSNAVAGIGKHVRHVLDHYRALLNGLNDAHVDYNQRSRNSDEEHCTLTAKQQIQHIIDGLKTVSQMDQQITVISEISLTGQASEQMNSYVNRELLYLINHSIHHMAYATLVARSQGVELPKHIGLAPSTASHERTQAQEAVYES